MTVQTKLELKGTLQNNPLAELLAEIAATNLPGSFRLSSEERKIIIYINNGTPVFAVSNQRAHRLFEILLQNEKLGKDQLAGIPNFTNDLELATALKEKTLLSEEETCQMFSVQIEEIIKSALEWAQGDWIFTPHARVKGNLHFKVNLRKLLSEYARNLPNSQIVKRYRSFNETYGINPSAVSDSVEMLPQEAFVLSRFERTFLKINEIRTLSGLADIATMRTLYTLWLSGFLYRQNWNPAFSERKISEINSARLSLKKDEPEAEAVKEETSLPAISLHNVRTADSTPLANSPAPPPQMPVEKPALTLEDYLQRVENHTSYYDLLDLNLNAELSDIKRNYFALAKRFHPDRYHHEKDADLIRRVQNAFSQTAHAYETLKNEDTRRTYDYKLTKYDLSAKRKSASGSQEEKLEIATESFEQGFNLMMEEEYERALPLLARAVQYAPEIARYHAYYGKVLSLDETHRHKAEAEMQTALRLEPQNATFRLIMAEFYIQYDLHRRAEGELQRLLAIEPNHREAMELLASLRNS